MKQSLSIKIEGLVQGVGFRPFVWKLATSLSLAGCVQNNPDGVHIRLEGDTNRIKQFLDLLQTNPPPLAKIISIQTETAELQNMQDFQIQHSETAGDFSTHIMPDMSLCADCRSELLNPADRRYHYPFINCTNCGPRFSIIQNLPYDRAATSMSVFDMCAECAAEYNNPADRRYHAQPVACPACGPRIIPMLPDGTAIERPWRVVWQDALEQGRIVAIKGIGGFHLACNALDETAAHLLRTRKQRESKPFAIMTPDLDWVRSVCRLAAEEEKLLTSRERPIVILKVKNDFPALKYIAPGLDTLGIMIPYSPLHELLVAFTDTPLVMTSANYSSEPMIHTNQDALCKLQDLADVFLMHNRDIVNRCDDSVCISTNNHFFVTRPGRGIAPFSINCKNAQEAVAFGADLKNTFAVVHHDRVSISQYIGDLEHPGTQNILMTNVNRHLDFFKIKPQVVIHDLHPDYFSTRLATRFARDKNVPAIAVQHHHAHLAAGHAEYGLAGKAIGFALDGTGYGTDGTIWGGEIMVFDRQQFRRELHLKPVCLPGGDMAVKHPQRMLIAYLHQAGLFAAAKDFLAFSPDCDGILQMITLGVNCPLTSSTGRLFDAVSCLLGICNVQTYDGEAAMRLEAAASPHEIETLPYTINEKTIDCSLMFAHLLQHMQHEVPADVLAGRFHNMLADIIFDCAERLTKKHGSLPLVFAGGVFQNRLLVEKILTHKKAADHKLFFCSYPNDSGIALGQAFVGISNVKSDE